MRVVKWPQTWQLVSDNGRERSHEVSTRASVYGPLKEGVQRKRLLLRTSSLSSKGQQEEGWRPNHDAVTEVIQETWPDTRVPRLDYCRASDLLGLWVPRSEVWRELNRNWSAWVNSKLKVHSAHSHRKGYVCVRESLQELSLVKWYNMWLNCVTENTEMK